MTWQARLQHEFIDRIPRELEQGVLYISMRYATAAHSCACGCGEEVVTPFTPTDWRMTFDGEAISLSPSIGNWQLPCRSHYILERGQVVRAGSWSPQRIRAEQARDRRVKEQHYAVECQPVEESAPAPVKPENQAGERLPRFMRLLACLFRG